MCRENDLKSYGLIFRKEYSKLFDFLKSKKIRIQNTKGGDDTFADDFGDGHSASDNEMPDHYLEKMKKEGTIYNNIFEFSRKWRLYLCLWCL